MKVKKELILYYHPLEEAGARRAFAVFERLGIPAVLVNRQDITQQIGCLAGLPGFGKKPVPDELPEIREEVMVLSDIGGARLDDLLAALKEAQIPRIELKAVVTDINKKWKFYQLYEELRKENFLMRTRRPQ